MKRSALVPILCCTALGLALAIGWVSKPRPAAVMTASNELPALPSPATVRVVRKNSGNKPATESAFNWQSVESEDYKIYIANLRAIGAPESTVRDIIFAEINTLYEPREAPLRSSPEAETSRSGSDTLSLVEFEKRKQLRVVQLEKRALIKELLGIDLPLALLPSIYWRIYTQIESALAALPESKREAVQFLKETYWQQSDALKDKHNNNRTPEYYAEYKDLNARHNAELAKILTPSEMEEFDMRTSATANRLGSELSGLGSSEAEFRELYKITRQYEEKTGRVGNRISGLPVDTSTQQAAAQERSEQIRTLLGEDRYAEYQRLQESRYRNLTVVAERFGLAAGAAQRAWELHKSFEEQVVQLRPGRGAGPEENARISARVAELQNNLDQSLTEVLGERASKVYRHDSYQPQTFE